mmetsp:Transcript_90796/g.136020  ORF Transcript_90796/g.136020 Transcript_90796/m.136020 type:complete len:172 (+) Transcript_90796:2-517(+)
MCNIQLATFVFIPLMAAGMANGEKIDFHISWETEAAVDLSVFFGLATKNLWDAWNFEEDRRNDNRAGVSNSYYYGSAPLVRSNNINNSNNSNTNLARRALPPATQFVSPGEVRRQRYSGDRDGLISVSDEPRPVRRSSRPDTTYGGQRYSDLVQVFPNTPSDGVVDVGDYE